MIHRALCSTVRCATGRGLRFSHVVAALFALALVVPVLATPALADDDTAAESAGAEAPADTEGAKTAEVDHGKDRDAAHKEGEHKEGAGSGDGHGGDGHGGDGHGGDGDLGHANATPSLEAAEEWKFDLAIFTFVVFLLLMGILLKFAWGPIMEALNNRETRIATLIDEAEASALRAKEELAAYEVKLAAAHLEADKIVTQAKQAAQEQTEVLIAEAREASQRERDRAVADIELAKNEALGEITQRSVDIALGLAKSVVGREIRAEDHDSLIQEALSKFPS